MCGQAAGDEAAKKPAGEGLPFPINTPLKTRDGTEAYLFEYNEETGWYFGRYRRHPDGGWRVTYWHKNGRFSESTTHPLDLVLHPRITQAEFYLWAGAELTKVPVTVTEYADRIIVDGTLLKNG